MVEFSLMSQSAVYLGNVSHMFAWWGELLNNSFFKVVYNGN